MNNKASLNPPQLTAENPEHEKLCQEIWSRSAGWVAYKFRDEALAKLRAISCERLREADECLTRFLGWKPRCYEILSTLNSRFPVEIAGCCRKLPAGKDLCAVERRGAQTEVS